MPRVKPRKADYSSAPKAPVRRFERKGHLVQEGKPKGRLKALLATPARARDEEVEKALDNLQGARAESDAFLRAMTKGEE